MKKGWRHIKIGDEIDLKTGFPFKSNSFTENEDDIKLLRGDNIVQGDLRWEKVKRWPKSEAKEYGQFMLSEGDVMLAMDRPWIEAGLKRAIIRKEDLPCLQVQRTARLRGTKNLLTEYLGYIISTKTFETYVRQVNTGSNVPHISSKQINDFEFEVPPIEDQQKIAKVLSDLDAKIELNNKINQELEAISKLIYDYWFVQFDFPNENGKPYKSSGGKMVYNKELKREIPEGWAVKELHEISTCIMGQSPKGESYNQDGVGTPLLNGPADYENGSLKARTYTTSPTRLCEKNDMVLCIRATIGNLVYSEDEFCIGRGVAAVRPHEVKMSEYIFYVLNWEVERFKLHATGSIIKGITKDDLTGSKCLLPEDFVIQSFHKKIFPMFSMMRQNKLQNQELSTLRDWLLPMLMNGQVRVGGDVS